MRNLSGSLLLLLISIYCSAQEWKVGEVRFNNGESEILQFKLNHYLFEGSIIIQNQERQYTFTPEQIQSFEFEGLQGKTHLYRSLLLEVEGLQRPKKHFLEVLHEGTISLYRHTWDLPKNPYKASSPENVVTKEILIAGKPEATLFPITDWAYYNPGRTHFPGSKKKRLLQSMGVLKPQIKDFVKSSNLSYSRLPDLIAILSYYDDLSNL